MYDMYTKSESRCQQCVNLHLLTNTDTTTGD